MADFIRLRVAAARAGVSLALAALIGGLTAPGSAASRPHATGGAGAGANFLKLNGISGNVRQGFLKLELKFLKLDSALGALEHKLVREYPTATSLRQYLKLSTANASFLKIDAANANFLKIEDANVNFLKIDDANLNFLKIDAANSEFLKIGATAANANEFGGATPQSFERSVTGTALIPSGGGAAQATLLSTPGGELVVKAGVTAPGAAPGAPFVSISNGTTSMLPAVQDLDAGGNATTSSADIPAGQAHTVSFTPGNNPLPAQLHTQFFNVPGLFGSPAGEAVTLVVSVESDGNGNVRFVAQLLSGSL